MKIKFVLLLVGVLGLLSFGADQDVDESKKFKMYLAAIDNQTTGASFLVFVCKNKNTGDVKEFCVEAPFLEGAISKEKGINIFAAIDFAKKQKDRTFEFSKEEALWNLNYDMYSKTDFDKYQATMDAEKIVRQVKNGQLKSKTFPQEGKDLNMYAHLLFNHGVLMTRSLVALNTFDFTYFE